jgi:hypothetical protein
MKLTEEDFEIEDACFGDGSVQMMFKIVFDYEKDAKELKQQILQNQEKAEKWNKLVLNGTCGIPHHVELEQQIKELKEENKRLKNAV